MCRKTAHPQRHAERHYTLVFPPLIFSFFGARRRWPAAKRGLQEHTELPAKGWRWTTMQPCGLCPDVVSRAGLAVGLNAPKISQPCRVTVLDQARTRPKPRLVTSVESEAGKLRFRGAMTGEHDQVGRG